MSDFPPGRFGLSTLNEQGKNVLAVLTDSGVAPLTNVLGFTAPSSVREMLTDWDGWCDRIADALKNVSTVQWADVADVTFEPPVADTSNLYLAGANYYDHIREMQAAAPDKSTDSVFHFMVPTTSLTGMSHDVVRPAGVERFDWEVELAVLIGRSAYQVSVDDALDYVAGYTVANDVSVRDESLMHPIFGVRFLPAKGQSTLTPIGPALVPARFVSDPGVLALSMLVNGEVRQNSNTAQMIWSVQEQIAHLSAQATLLPGDLILTGTPAGTAAAHAAYLADGDVMTASIEGLGALVNRVVPANAAAS